MRKVVIGVSFIIVFLLGKGELLAQKSLPKETSCQSSAEEILSLIKSIYNLSPISEGVLIAGEVRTGYIRIRKEPASLRQTLAMVGGAFKTAKHPFYLIRQSAEYKTSSKLIIDVRDIRKGLAKDEMLEKGDVVFIPRGCVDGHLLPPTNPIYLRAPGGTDDPIKIPNKRIGR